MATTAQETRLPLAAFWPLLALWLAVAVPLTVLGASLAWRWAADCAFPAEVSKQPRDIPPASWYRSPVFAVIAGGLLPFGCVFLELRFVFSSAWLGYPYDAQGFLAITVLLWLLNAALVTIVVIYNGQLAGGDWRWWWRAFLFPSGCGLPIMVFSAHFYWTVLDVHSAAGTLLYSTYTLLFAIAYTLATGVVGLFATLLFVVTIYARCQEAADATSCVVETVASAVETPTEEADPPKAADSTRSCAAESTNE